MPWGTHLPTHCLGRSLWLEIKDAVLMNSYWIVLKRDGKEFWDKFASCKAFSSWCDVISLPIAALWKTIKICRCPFL